MRPLALVLAASLAAAADAPAPVAPAAPATPAAPAAPPAAAPAPAIAPAPADEATRIAADIIKGRALDAAGAGNLDLATQLHTLAKGLLEGRVTLYDASLVMQIAATPRGSAATTTLTPEARAGARRATDLLDGGAPVPGAAPAPAAPGTGAQPLATMPEPAQAPAAPTGSPPAGPVTPTVPPTAEAPAPAAVSKVYATDVGSDGKANVAAIGLGSRAGVQVGHRFLIKRRDLHVAQAKVVRVKESLCYAEIVKGSLVDPRDDVREGDQAVWEK